MIQLKLAALLRKAISDAQDGGALPAFAVPPFALERPARKEHGDWSAGIALVVAKQAGRKPREVADAIVTAIGTPPDYVSKIEVAGPGFVNFHLSHAWLTSVVREVHEAGDAWGRTQAGEPERVQVEYVSANPTGPMHLGHGRWAAVGDTLARLLEWTGHEVEREFYINDYGGQMQRFGRSVSIRYLEHFGREAPPIPEGGYVGDYVRDLAAEIAAEVGDRFLDVDEAERDAFMGREGGLRMLARQRALLERFGARFDVWFSETTLHDAGEVQKVFDACKDKELVYEAEGAQWLATERFGDHKDRVVTRSADGSWTYLMPDLAYWLDKRRRGFDRVIYLLGADHQDHVSEMHAGIRAIGDDPDAAEFVLGQHVRLVESGESHRMAKRTGKIVWFDDLVEAAGVDATRYFFLRTSLDRTVNFDLELATQQTQENPVYYVQYAHARICSILRKAEAEGVQIARIEEVALGELQHESELDLLRKIAELPEAVEVAARLRAPHRMTTYAEEVAALFHAFYRDCRVISDDPALTQARLHLVRAAKTTLHNVLTLVGVTAPESM